MCEEDEPSDTRGSFNYHPVKICWDLKGWEITNAGETGKNAPEGAAEEKAGAAPQRSFSCCSSAAKRSTPGPSASRTRQLHQQTEPRAEPLGVTDETPARLRERGPRKGHDKSASSVWV